MNCERIELDSVKAALSTSNWLQKGKHTSFSISTIIDAYHGHEFSEIIISFSFLLLTKNLDFSENEQGTALFYIN